jgi:hypothetical protein
MRHKQYYHLLGEVGLWTYISVKEAVVLGSYDPI